ncbi:unnamed protein product [Didymodactylos carnosus]|uniref:NAD(P)(+)--arginine ADP-ribosyltransferase n=1 Tax=Didymodactylos carnosus TaxID=1234261 RepID=A0A815LSG1_9BILA|nr:unnamed protein product [Didymodactylos carnosus]CAF1412550.1 unnamed protein product [Didymodactylos carnosus]CAF3750115.1 unnamed protein product [Didymodactylos carnosus]CAF4300289.1 unnamed protein product [Didymodactylos carnosus]
MGCYPSRVSPTHRIIEQRRKQKFTTGNESEFYVACKNGDIEFIRNTLPTMTKEDLDKLEPNGDTALHVATRAGYAEIVDILLKAECCTTTINYAGRRPYQEASSEQIRIKFDRSTVTGETSDKFHDSDTNVVYGTIYTGLIKHHPLTPAQTRATTEETEAKSDFFHAFRTREEYREYVLNHQTTAMWLQFYNWVSRKGIIQHQDYDSSWFSLEKDRDFLQFLEKTYKNETDRKKIEEQLQCQNIEPLITLYTHEAAKNETTGEKIQSFYSALNKQLATGGENQEHSAHLCDRFLMEFYVRQNELTKRTFRGATYRGASMSDEEVLAYEEACDKEHTGIIYLKSFTSTTMSIKVALKFIQDKLDKQHEKNSTVRKPVLYIFNIKKESKTIFQIEDISKYPNEKEVLILPGNLFKVKKVMKDVEFKYKDENTVEPINTGIRGSEIHLEYVNESVSFFRKLAQTFKAARTNTLQS